MMNGGRSLIVEAAVMNSDRSLITEAAVINSSI